MFDPICRRAVGPSPGASSRVGSATRDSSYRYFPTVDNPYAPTETIASDSCSFSSRSAEMNCADGPLTMMAIGQIDCQDRAGLARYTSACVVPADFDRDAMSTQEDFDISRRVSACANLRAR